MFRERERESTETTITKLCILLGFKLGPSQYLPSILLMFELCISGCLARIFLLSSFAHTMKAFIGLLMCGLLASLFLASRYILAMVASFEDGEVEGDGEEEVGVVMEVAIETGNRC